ncbi:rod shape-determining protein MreB [candidate division WOR_3 bacterium SM23_42]|uniref:Cell shape-determining protein MreB n=1 Tax=candidate division WOR_3 bacterium SM23_42 TaxID=1703779 RepID=A0A0S8FW49_UNCW3|nr:MAG: rod shape-determining protein MreB [candidate division WOR_3 bacterium SM23_42]
MFSLFRSIKSQFLSDIAIDLGTRTTLIYINSRGIVLDEPTVVAIDTKTKRCLAIGDEAKQMLGRTPNEIKAIRPMKDGVIADFEMVELLLRIFIEKVQKKRLLMRPRVLICVPSGITEVEKRAVRDSAEAAGAREVFLVPEPISAAIGIGLPVHSPTGNMIIDIGGGTTEIAVIALSGIVTNSSIRIAGDEMDDAIVQYIKKNYNLIIGEQSAETIKIAIGNAFPTVEEKALEVKGRDLVSGIPKTVKLTSHEVREAIQEPLSMITETIRLTLEKTPPELAADIVNNGIYMAGGGSLLRGVDTLVREETNLPVTIADEPNKVVVIGAGKILEDLNKYEKVIYTMKRA